MIAIFKRYSKEKSQKNLKYKNNEVQNTFKSCIVRNYEQYWKEVFLVKKEFFFFLVVGILSARRGTSC